MSVPAGGAAGGGWATAGGVEPRLLIQLRDGAVPPRTKRERRSASEDERYRRIAEKLEIDTELFIKELERVQRDAPVAEATVVAVIDSVCARLQHSPSRAVHANLNDITEVLGAIRALVQRRGGVSRLRMYVKRLGGYRQRARTAVRPAPADRAWERCRAADAIASEVMALEPRETESRGFQGELASIFRVLATRRVPRWSDLGHDLRELI